MATIPVHFAPQDDESRKLQEALRACDVPSRGDDDAADPCVTSAPEPGRTRRFRAELERIDLGATVILFAGLVFVVLASLLF